MNQYPSHSQTPQFDTKISATTKLYHELPKPQPKHRKIIAKIKVNAVEFSKFLGISLIAWVIISFIITSYFGS